MPGGHSTSLIETPRRPRFGAVDNFGSQRPRSKLAPVLEERTKRSSALPGFENAFLKSPSRTQRQKDKGKGRQQDDRAAENIFFTGHARSSPPSSPSFPAHAGPPEVTMDDVDPPRSSDRPGDSRKTKLSVDLGADLGAYRDEDVQMAENQVSALDLEEDVSEGEPPNWRDEVSHINRMIRVSYDLIRSDVSCYLHTLSATRCNANHATLVRLAITAFYATRTTTSVQCGLYSLAGQSGCFRALARLGYSLAHASCCALRTRTPAKPSIHRSYHPLNIKYNILTGRCRSINYLHCSIYCAYYVTLFRHSPPHYSLRLLIINRRG